MPVILETLLIDLLILLGVVAAFLAVRVLVVMALTPPKEMRR